MRYNNTSCRPIAWLNCAFVLYSGESGNILIHSSANRLNSYNVLDYAEGHDVFYSAMLVDLTQARDKVKRSLAAYRSAVQRIIILG